MISFLQPLFRSLLGSVLIAFISLIKYVVIVGGLAVIVIVMTSEKSPQPQQSEREDSRHYSDFDPIGINSLEVTQNGPPAETPKKVVNTAAYESFIRRAE